ncbi:hypothetical protein HD554DRAFT_1992871, partial [Boletus coccyginus]
SLVIHKDKEFYLFMDLHTKYKWVSHEMTPKKWVEAAAEYNKCLIAKQEPSIVFKNPLVLLWKLGELKPKLMSRIMKGDY